MPPGGDQPQRLKIEAAGGANAVREQARGKADGNFLLATAPAKGKEHVDLAEAKALEAQGQALRSNDGLIQLEFAKRGSGNVNMYAGARPRMAAPLRQGERKADVIAAARPDPPWPVSSSGRSLCV
jgi:hypothetical protein